MIKLNFNTVLHDLEGNAITEGKVKNGAPVTEAVLDENSRPVTLRDGSGVVQALHRIVQRDFTAHDLALRALTADAVSGMPVKGDDKLKRAALGIKIIDAKGELDLTSEEVTLLKDLTKELAFGTAVVYAFCQFMEGQPQREPAAT